MVGQQSRKGTVAMDRAYKVMIKTIGGSWHEEFFLFANLPHENMLTFLLFLAV